MAPRDSVSEERYSATPAGLVEQLAGQIREFEASLNENHVPAIIVSGAPPIALEQVGFHNPGLVLFIGRDPHGQPARILQHMSQFNIALISVRRDEGLGPKKPIGFDLPMKPMADSPTAASRD
jgi:hypothetical protein